MLITLLNRIFIVTCILTLLLSGCSSKDEAKKDTDNQTTPKTDTIVESISNIGTVDSNPNAKDLEPYSYWGKFQYRNIKLFYPSDYEDKDQIPQMTKFYESSIRKTAAFLNVAVPTDTLLVFIHNSVKDGRDRSGKRYPYYQNDSLFYWPPYNFGVSIVDYITAESEYGETKFNFLKQGIRRLLDASGRNFHTMTFDFIDSGQYISLLELSADDKMEANLEYFRSSFSASFVDFVVFTYGVDGLKNMYRSKFDFETATNHIFQLPPDSLEKVWMSVVKKSLNRK